MARDITAVLKRDLTNEQFAAALDTTPDVLCLACAGSGKSRTLAYRIARLVAEGSAPGSIVAFTFTEKAADTIKLRVAAALEASGQSTLTLGAMYVGTIHAFCQNVLGDMDATYRQFDVLDDNRLKLFLISNYGPLGLPRLKADRALGRYFEVIDEVAKAWSTMNEESLKLEDVQASDAVLGGVLSELDRMLHDKQFIDFTLMIRLVVDALDSGHQGAISAVSALRHLMVDEYQDVNPLQERLIHSLRQYLSTLFVVGDDDQAIYAWRGADVGNILTFANRYAGAASHTLNVNFRSTEPIVRTADEFAAAELGPTRLVKSPIAFQTVDPRDYRTLWFDTRATEAEWVAERIQHLLDTEYLETVGGTAVTRGLTPADFAILMRSTATKEQDQSPRHAAFTAALEARNIPYSLEAGGSVFDRAHVAILREAFELLRESNPRRDTVETFFHQRIVASYPHASFDRFVQVVAEWGRRIHPPRGGPRVRVYPQQLVHDLLSAFRIATEHLDSGTMQAIGTFSRMMQDVEAVYLSVDSSARFNQILNFLNHVAETGYDAGTYDALKRPDTITVSTVHKMKGLEFPVVFIVDAEAQRFPKRKQSYRGLLPSALIGPAVARGAYQSTAEEEARLFYTAVTRAERFIYVSGAERLPGGRKPRKQSGFTRRLTHPDISSDPNTLPTGLSRVAGRRRLDETVIPTSFSDVRYYLRCPRDYLFRKVFGFSPPISDLIGFGTTVHAAVCKLHEVTTGAPVRNEAVDIAEQVFHLKHVPESNDPINTPGPYERAKEAAKTIVGDYAEEYASDFARLRQVEVRFEIPVENAVITGSIDLMLKMDEAGGIADATVVDFKTLEGGDEPAVNERLDWTELALQVQLYARAAIDVLGEPARTGAVHLLKDNQRVAVPVHDTALQDALSNVEWAVARIIDDDFPMRPQREKCATCDFQALCPQTYQDFNSAARPPAIHVPGDNDTVMARAFSACDT